MEMDLEITLRFQAVMIVLMSLANPLKTIGKDVRTRISMDGQMLMMHSHTTLFNGRIPMETDGEIIMLGLMKP